MPLISEIKDNIRNSRYNAAKAVNKELLLLYFNIGYLLSSKISEQNWGAKVLEHISFEIQQDFAGIRGFSVRNLKNMKQFYQNYSFLPIGQSATAQIDIDLKRQSATAQLEIKNIEIFLNDFFRVSFTAHILILNKCNNLKEYCFYIEKSANNQWTVDLLGYHLETNLYKNKGNIQNNFDKTLPEKFKSKAIAAFRDELMLNFIQVDDENDERLIESEIVKNIKDFMMSLGKEFSFMGNQYRLVVDGDEFFVDLLFFHRGLQSLIAIELKTGKFKPEYAGKMNFYLAALDEYVKLQHENPSIGIILCKEKSKAIVEFAFRYTDSPIGVGTYKLTTKLPKEYAKYLPKPEDFKKLLECEADNAACGAEI